MLIQKHLRSRPSAHERVARRRGQCRAARGAAALVQGWHVAKEVVVVVGRLGRENGLDVTMNPRGNTVWPVHVHLWPVAYARHRVCGGGAASGQLPRQLAQPRSSRDVIGPLPPDQVIGAPGLRPHQGHLAPLVGLSHCPIEIAHVNPLPALVRIVRVQSAQTRCEPPVTAQVAFGKCRV